MRLRSSSSAKKAQSSSRESATANQSAAVFNSLSSSLVHSDSDTTEDNTDKISDSPLADSVTISKSTNESPMHKVLVRTGMGCCMVIFYCSMLRGGYMYCILVGVVTQTELFRELVNVRYKKAQEKSMPLFRTIQWTWFTLAMFFIYGESFHKFCSGHKQMGHLTQITQYIEAIVFALYCILFMITVLTFKQGLIRFQLKQLMWTIVTVVMVVCQTKFLARCTLNGLFWFFFPMATVVMNDVSAYFCGITMGKKFIKTPFLALSPKKTWEGFIGAGVLTCIFSFLFPVLLARFPWFTCPAEKLTFIPPPLDSISCTVNEVFLPREYLLPSMLGGHTIELLPIQLHGIAYGIFASVVAPFGGFMASAIKRGYDIKDFDNFFPGHGGMMDRMDCQLIIHLFTYVHYHTFIAPKIPTLEKMLVAVSMLSLTDQTSLYEMLGDQIKLAQERLKASS